MNQEIPFPSFFMYGGFNGFYSEQLNQSEIQRLQFVLRTILNHIGQEREETKRHAKILYTKCDKADCNTQEMFDFLNSVRNVQRKQKKFYKELSVIQNKLKKMQKEVI